MKIKKKIKILLISFVNLQHTSTENAGNHIQNFKYFITGGLLVLGITVKFLVYQNNKINEKKQKEIASITYIKSMNERAQKQKKIMEKLLKNITIKKIENKFIDDNPEVIHEELKTKEILILKKI
jgi:competence protein ComGF